MCHYPVIVVGGGQSGFATSFYLNRFDLDHLVLDERDEPGGGWIDSWDSLRLFSPAGTSSLPGPRFPTAASRYPNASEVVEYLEFYRDRVQVPVVFGSRVSRVGTPSPNMPGRFHLTCASGESYTADHLIAATGTRGRPFVPATAGVLRATRPHVQQMHSSSYRNPQQLIEAGAHKVAIVGGGNSGGQLAAELCMAPQIDATWFTLKRPILMPDDVDGSVLFSATAQVNAHQLAMGRRHPSGPADDRQAQPEEIQSWLRGLGEIISTPDIQHARDAGVLFENNRSVLSGVPKEDAAILSDSDLVLWCTGFRDDLMWLKGLPGVKLRGDSGHPRVRSALPTASADVDGLWFMGYGNWCGKSSATISGVSRFARATAREIASAAGKRTARNRRGRR